MKKFLLLTAVLLSFAAGAQTWSPLDPAKFPTNISGQIHGISRVSQMKYHPTDSNKLYAVSARGGLFLSTNQGNSWTVAPGCDKMPAGSRFASVCIDPVNDQIIYLGTGDANYYSSVTGVWKSTDGGNTFVISNTGMGNRLVIEILIDPSNRNTLIAATNNGIYKSIDAGANWVLKSTSALQFQDLVFKANSGTKTLFAATATAYYRSTNMGETWTQVTAGLTLLSGGTRLGVTPADSNVVYLSSNAAYGTIYKSTDGGSSFTMLKSTDTLYNLTGYGNTPGDVGQGNYNTGLGVDRLNPNIVYFVSHPVWKSTDGGVTWTQLTNWWEKIHTDMHQTFTSPYNNQKLWNMNDGGVWLSTDGGVSWTPKSDGIYGYEIYNGRTSPMNRDVVMTGTQDNGGVFYDGTGWYTNAGGDLTTNLYFDNRVRSDVFYQMNKNQRKSVRGSLANYTSVNKSAFHIEFSKLTKDIAFYCDSFSIFRTRNLMNTLPTWDTVSSVSKIYTQLYYPKSDSNTLYAMTSDQKLYVCNNILGATPIWVQRNLPNSATSSYKITGNPLDASVLYVICNTRVYSSVDGGQNWTNITYNLPSVNHVGLLFDDAYPAQNILYCASANGVYVKKGNATTWTSISTGLPTYPTIKNFSAYIDQTSASVMRVSTYGRGMWSASMGVQRDFQAAATYTESLSCDGDSVRFVDASNGNEMSRQWYFPGGTPSTSTDSMPVVLYNVTGTYNVKLVVFNGTSYDSVTYTNLISYSPPCAVDTVPGRAQFFSGTASYVTVPKLPFTSNTVTYSAWVKINSLQPDYSAIFMNDGTATGMNFKVSGSSNYLGCHWNGTGIWSSRSVDSIPMGKWTHVAVVITPTNVTYYVNGRASVATNSNTAYNFNNNSQRIGRYQTWTSRNMDNALIDELCVYKRALSQSEIREMMHLTKNPTADTNLVLYYQFNESESNTVVYDKTYRKLHGSINSTVKSTSTAAVGGGTFSRQSITAAGTYTFGSTGLTMQFASGTVPNGELVVTRINLTPDQTPQLRNWNSRSYWVVNNYGSNTTFTPLTSMTFANVGMVPNSAPASGFKVYKRSSFVDGNTWGTSLNSATATTPSTDGTVQFASPGVSSFSMFTVVNESGVLPLEWMYFTGRLSGGMVDLDWKMNSSAGPMAFFEVMRSNDGSTFNKIGEVSATGFVAHHFTDSFPIGGKNYYKIIAHDLNGMKHSSFVVQVDLLAKDKITLFPNPLKLGAPLMVESQSGEAIMLTVYDVSGKYLFSRLLNSKQELPLNLSSGLYVYLAEIKGFKQSGTFVVQ